MLVRIAFASTLALAALAYACGEELPETADQPPPVRGSGTDANATDTGTPVDAAPRCNVDAGFGTPRPLVELNSADVEKWGRLTSDELMIVFGSSRGGKSGGPFRFWIATRANRDDPFSKPEEILAVTDMEAGETGFDSDPALSPDGLDLVFTRDRGVDTDIWVAHRSSRKEPFGMPTPVSELNTSLNEFHPFFSATGIWFVRQEEAGAKVGNIFYAQRNANATYGNPSVVRPPSVDGNNESMPSPRRDGLAVFYGAPAAGADADTPFDVWMIQRSAVDPNFGAPTRVSELSTGVHEEVSWVSDDGCRVYLHRSTGDETRDDLYVADRPAN
jgi:hypothetical protein